MDECTLCGGALQPLGILGRLEHSRCRNCGAQFTWELEEQATFEDRISRLEAEHDALVEESRTATPRRQLELEASDRAVIAELSVLAKRRQSRGCADV